jgi:hypothetical protein
MDIESRVIKLEKENKKMQKLITKQNKEIGYFLMTYIGVVPTLLRIMERMDPDDNDLQYLIDLFQKSGFEYEKFKEKYEGKLDDCDSLSVKQINIIKHETEMFCDLIRRSYDCLLPKARFDKSFFP